MVPKLKLVPTLFMEDVQLIFQLDNTQLFLRNDQLVRILHTYPKIPKGHIQFSIQRHSNQLRIFHVVLLFSNGPPHIQYMIFHMVHTQCDSHHVQLRLNLLIEVIIPKATRLLIITLLVEGLIMGLKLGPIGVISKLLSMDCIKRMGTILVLVSIMLEHQSRGVLRSFIRLVH